MCVRIAKLLGASRVALVGSTNKSRRGSARSKVGMDMGADIIVQALDENAVEAITEYFGGGADSIIVTSPPETLPDAIKMAGFGGTISIAGINLGGKNMVEVDVNYLIFNKLTIKSTFAEPALRFPTAIKLIRDGLIDAKK